MHHFTTCLSSSPNDSELGVNRSRSQYTKSCGLAYRNGSIWLLQSISATYGSSLCLVFGTTMNLLPFALDFTMSPGFIRSPPYIQLCHAGYQRAPTRKILPVSGSMIQLLCRTLRGPLCLGQQYGRGVRCLFAIRSRHHLQICAISALNFNHFCIKP